MRLFKTPSPRAIYGGGRTCRKTVVFRQSDRPHSRGGLGFCDDTFQHGDQVVEVLQSDVTAKDLIFQVNGQAFESWPEFWTDIGHNKHLTDSMSEYRGDMRGGRAAADGFAPAIWRRGAAIACEAHNSEGANIRSASATRASAHLESTIGKAPSRAGAFL